MQIGYIPASEEFGSTSMSLTLRTVTVRRADGLFSAPVAPTSGPGIERVAQRVPQGLDPMRRAQAIARYERANREEIYVQYVSPDQERCFEVRV
jgi:hypothetical protein